MCHITHPYVFIRHCYMPKSLLVKHLLINLFDSYLISCLFVEHFYGKTSVLYDIFGTLLIVNHHSSFLLSATLASLECFSRYLSGEGISTLAGPIVLLEALFCCFSCFTCSLNLDVYLKINIT